MSKEIKIHFNQPYSPENKRFGNFIIKDKALYSIVEEGKAQYDYVGEAVWIKSIRQNYETNDVEIQLGYYYLGQEKEITVSREALQTRELPKLMTKGVGVQKHVVDTVSLFLTIQEKDAPYIVSHSGLGWDQENQRQFKLHEIIGSSNSNSEYTGMFDVKPKGTFEAWEEGVKTHVIPFPNLSLALVLGLSAPVASLISNAVDIETLIVHIFGESSTGKTRSVKLAVSAFGKPSDSHDGLVQSWNGTQKSIIQKMSGVHGVPIVLDESSMTRIKNFTNFIYQVAMGIESSRLTQEIKQRERGKWSGVILSTGEVSLLGKSDQNTGLRVRTIELDNLAWTNSAEHAEALDKVITNNYGHAGPKFVKHLLTYETDQIVTKWEHWSKKCYEAMEVTDQFSQRIANKLALITVTAELMNETFDFKVDVEAILNVLLEVEQATVEERNIADRAYMIFQQKVYQNRSKFQSVYFAEKAYECYGKITKKSDYLEVAVLTEVFKKWMAEADFADISVLLKAFRDKGWLDHDKDKFTKKRSIKDISEARPLTYCIKLPKDFLVEKEDGTPPSPPVRIRPKKTSQPSDNVESFFMDGVE